MNLLRTILLLVTGTWTATAAVPPVVLKLDDLVAEDGKVPGRWAKVISFAETERIKTSIGIIGNSLDGDKPLYFEELKRLQSTGLIEFWHHGYDHRRWQVEGATVWEFSGTDATHQRNHFQRTQDLAKEKLGITFRTFGAPFNATDATTARILSTQPEIRVWLQGDPQQAAGKMVVRMIDGTNIEQPVHHPNFEAFRKGYQETARNPPSCYILQGHPNSWDEAAFAEYVRIVRFLQEHHHPFVLPAELPGLNLAEKP